MIIKLNQVKELLQINVRTYDALIETLIPQAISLFMKVRGVPFFRIDVNLTSGSAVLDMLFAGQIDRVSYLDDLESIADDGVKAKGQVTYVNLDDYDLTIDSEATVTEEDVEMVVYPGGAKYVIAKIIDFLMNKDNATGYQSESIGSYSYTKFEARSGLPKDISNLITQYQGMK